MFHAVVYLNYHNDDAKTPPNVLQAPQSTALRVYLFLNIQMVGFLAGEYPLLWNPSDW